MELKEDDYILGCWFAVDPDDNDWLMTIKRKQDDPLNWTGEYRFRYRVDNKVFQSQDRKSFYSFTITNQTEEQVIEQLNKLVDMIREQYSKFFKYTEIKGNSEKFAFRYLQEDFANCTMISPEDFKNQRGHNP